MATVFIPAILRPLAGGVEKAEAGGGTVREVVSDLVRQYPGLKGRVVDGEGIRPEVFIAVGGEEAFGLDAPVPAGAEVHILPAMAGGAA
jgi:molybdopterin converting factor small subunit